ncbi:MAG: TylF/MycF family methyltransferase [Thermoanaerobaculia bacterium]
MKTVEKLYLELLKDTLQFALWPEPDVPVELSNASRGGLLRFLVNSASKVLALKKMKIVKALEHSEKEVAEGRIWPRYADTMIGRKRLENIQYCVETVLSEGVVGDLIETGVWKGGACIFMRGILAAYGVGDRMVYVADSFQGLPEPNPDRFPADRESAWHSHGVLAISQADVENNFRRYGLLDDQVVFLKGWFKDTLPIAPIERLAVLRLDGDMYESTIDALSWLYPKLSVGGFCIVDDYSLPECRQAVADYRSANGITCEMVEIDWTGLYWRK